jgi:hypothetical protein
MSSDSMWMVAEGERSSGSRMAGHSASRGSSSIMLTYRRLLHLNLSYGSAPHPVEIGDHERAHSVGALLATRLKFNRYILPGSERSLE